MRRGPKPPRRRKTADAKEFREDRQARLISMSDKGEQPRTKPSTVAGSVTFSAISHGLHNRGRRPRVPHRPCPRISPWQPRRFWPKKVADNRPPQEIRG